MSHDHHLSEKTNGRIPQDIDSPIEHPCVSTEKDSEPSLHPSLSPSSIDTTEDPISPIPDGDVETQQGPPARSKSRTSSTRSKAQSIIPRSKRRGLLGRFAIIPEVERPKDYPRATKWLITFIVALAAAAAPMGSAIFYRKWKGSLECFVGFDFGLV